MTGVIYCTANCKRRSPTSELVDLPTVFSFKSRNVVDIIYGCHAAVKRQLKVEITGVQFIFYVSTDVKAELKNNLTPLPELHGVTSSGSKQW